MRGNTAKPASDNNKNVKKETADGKSKDVTMIIAKLGNTLEEFEGQYGLDHDDIALMRLIMIDADSIVLAMNAILTIWVTFHMSILLITCIPVDAVYKKFFTRLLYSAWKRIYPHACLRWSLNCIPLIVFFARWFISTPTLEAVPSDSIDLRPWMRFWLGICSLGAVAISIFAQRGANRLVSLGIDQTLELEYQIQEQRILRFRPPKRILRSTIGILDDYIVRSQIFGINNLPKQKNDGQGKGVHHHNPQYIPGQFVMNHMLHGLESPFFLHKLYEESGIFVRGLADHLHLSIPVHASVFQAMGAVDGTRRYSDLLMKHQQHVLVYPGGSLEVHKRVSIPKYTLMWKDRLGFARQAIKYGYPIIPCASVGFEDMIDRLGDISMELLRKDLTLSIPGPIFPHRIQRLYFWIGQPIPTTQYNGDWQNDDYARKLRDLTKAAVESGIAFLRQKQANDPERFLFPGLAYVIDRLRNFKS